MLRTEKAKSTEFIIIENQLVKFPNAEYPYSVWPDNSVRLATNKAESEAEQLERRPILRVFAPDGREVFHASVPK